MNVIKIMCIRAGHIVLIDRNSFLLFALRKQPEAFGLTVVKSWYPHYINTTNLDYVEKLPDISYYEVDEISASERTGFLDWYDVRNSRSSKTDESCNPTLRVS